MRVQQCHRGQVLSSSLPPPAPSRHAGGYAVLKGIQSRLNLPTDYMLPSFATLREYGNTSCSTTVCLGLGGCSPHFVCWNFESHFMMSSWLRRV